MRVNLQTLPVSFWFSSVTLNRLNRTVEVCNSLCQTRRVHRARCSTLVPMCLDFIDNMLLPWLEGVEKVWNSILNQQGSTVLHLTSTGNWHSQGNWKTEHTLFNGKEFQKYVANLFHCQKPLMKIEFEPSIRKMNPLGSDFYVRIKKKGENNISKGFMTMSISRFWGLTWEGKVWDAIIFNLLLFDATMIFFTYCIII